MLRLVEELEGIFCDGEADGLLLARLKKDFLETLEFLDRTDNACLVVAYIELNDFLAGTLARVLYAYCNGPSLVAVIRDLCIRISERGVAETVTEWEYDFLLHSLEVSVAYEHILCINLYLVTLTHVSSWVLVRVGNSYGISLYLYLLEQIGRLWLYFLAILILGRKILRLNARIAHKSVLMCSLPY